MSDHSDARCLVRIRAWDKDDGTFSCRLAEGHIVPHEATGLFPYQTIEWYAGDRREFVGEYERCREGCYFPAGHDGNHA